MTSSRLGPRTTLHALVLKLVCLCALAFVSVQTTRAQNYVATQPDNSLTPADPIGTTPKPSAAGTYEAVNNLNGGLSFFLPALSLPQRGGWNLSLGYYNTSPQASVRQDVAITEGGTDPEKTYLTYTDNILPFQTGPLVLNMPTLQASIEYTGDVTISGNEYPTLCLTNWVFTDWSGNKHQFTNVTICSVANLGEQASTLSQATDASDGSWLRLNTTNYATSGITVTTKDGTVYTFPGFSSSAWPYPPCAPPTSGCSSSLSTSTLSNPWYHSMFSTMADSNGNTVTLAPTSGAGYQFLCGNCTLTDTISRKITISGDSITYYDSNGISQTVQVTPTPQSAQNYNLSGFACSTGKPPLNVIITVNTGQTQFSLQPSTYTVTFPPIGGTSRIYNLQFDGLNNLTQVTYPAGGYTKYVFPTSSPFPFFRLNFALSGCSQPEIEISQKRECPSGGCSSSQELVTTYTPTPDLAEPFNDVMAIQDPLGDTTAVYYQNMTTTSVAAHEVASYVYPPGEYTPCSPPPCGTPLRGIQTAYTPYQGGVDIQVPSQVTTILYDIQPNLSAVTNYQYETVPMTYYCVSNCGGTFQVDIDNPTEIDQYDYASSGTGTALKKTAETWMTTSNGLYSIGGGHLLDRLASRTITDPASQNQATLSYGYNSVGDITSKTVGGTSVTSLTTNYLRDGYGNITQMTDPKGNVTNWGYSWGGQSCAGTSLANDAYLTSITDAFSHVTNFTYYPCTGLNASMTDPNNATTSYTYDALGRPLTTARADGGQTANNYVDTIPNSVTTSSSITTTLNKVQATTLDGFGRTSRTELVSDPDGPDYLDTTYDSVNRTASVSNPYRSTSDSTYGITSYQYDPLDRTTKLTESDGSIVTTMYSGNVITVTDEAGKKRKSQSDALGWLTYVWEDPAGLNYQTNYTYDAFGNLLTVLQNSSRQRTFSYNTFSQLVNATNPESNTITYTYDNDGNVATKTSYAENQTNSTATPGTGSVTVGGSAECEGSTCDTGTIYITVNGYQVSTPYGNNTASSLASALASQLNSSSSPVTATAPSNVVYITSKATGPSANYSLSTSVTNSKSQQFPHAAFSTTASGSTLTGGSSPPTVTITYSYDKLNRLTEKSYTDGTPTVTYSYDGATPSGCSPTLTITNGIYRRTGMCDSVGWEAWSYNPIGHLTDDRRSTNSLIKDTIYVPNLDDSDGSITYPITGRVIIYTPGGAGLPLSASDGTTTYVTPSAHYAPNGAITSVTNGGNIYSTFIYNSRLQPCWNYATTGNALQWNSATQCTTTDSTPGTILDLKYSFNLGAGDNGNVYGITNDRDSTRSQAFVYDSLNRIQTAGTVNTSGTNCWGETYGIDAWANLYSLALPSSYSSSCSHETPFSYTIPNNNQLPSASGFTYDAAGNLMASGLGNYVYNAEHQMTSVTVASMTTTYSYDGDGKRVEKSGGRIYWYGGGSEALDETDLTGNTNNSTFSEYVSFGDRRVARRDYQNNVFYYLADHLGTSRVILEIPSGQNTATVCYDADFYSYGGEITPHSNSCPQNYKFTGKERDPESASGSSNGLDHFAARHDNSNFGRFMSPDWSQDTDPIPYADLAGPQSLNLYAYLRNNPLHGTDPDGHCCDVWDVIDFLTGLANAYSSDNLAGAGRQTQNTTAGNMGSAVGDTVATLEGTGKMLVGGGGDILSVPEDVTGAGALIGVPQAVLSTGLLVQGSIEGGQGFGNLLKDALTDKPYQRPNNATTKAQRDSVQGQPCATCGATGQKNYADHKEPLVMEYYRTGSINKTNMRSPDAVQPQCPSCSNQQGGWLSRFSKLMRGLLGL
jgi:RHS repeat-associated protein